MKHLLLFICLMLSGYGRADAGNLAPSPESSAHGRNKLTPYSSSPASTTTILTSGTLWQYLVTAGDPNPAWKSSPSFDAVNPPWYAGPSPLGYGGQGASAVTITSEGGTCVDQCVSGAPTAPSCKTCTTKSITTYFRKTISLNAVSGSTFSLRYQRDDGLVIYINGTEVIRENLPASPAPISYSSLATAFPSDADEVTWITIDPTSYSTLLQEGQNVIAAEVHQYSTTSSDIRFNLELIQTLPASDTFTTGAVWQYLVASGAPALGWKTDLLFNDTSPPWYGGPSPLGYGGQGDAIPPATSPPTVVDQGGTCVDECASNTITAPSCKTCTAKEITTYFRKKINLINVAASTISLRYQRDDGILIYINGTERVREGLPAGTIIHTTPATPIPTNAEELTWITVPVVPGWFTEGQNLIAVEIHQASATSSDIRFNMELLQTQNTITITRGPYLQMGTSTAATIRWRTNIPTTGRVTYGLSASSLTGTVSEPTSTTEHEIRLTGLLTDQQYFYSVGTTSGILEQGANNYFLTAPALTSKRKISIASFGDCGTNISTNQAYVRDAFLNFRGNTPTNLWILMGDNSYDGADAQYQTNFFDPYRSSLLKNSMLFPVPGNHDYNNSNADAASHAIPYYSIFTLPANGEAGGTPSGTEEWYSFDYGPIHFVMLDSYGTRNIGGTEKRYYEDTTNHPQAIWLKQDLANTTQKWKIVYFHHPPYTRGTHDSESESDLINTRQFINPILERFGVDMVVTGHSHVYERSNSMHDHYGFMNTFNETTHVLPEDRGSGRYDGSANTCPYRNTSEKKKQGTVYVVSGSSGALEPQKPDLGLHPAMVPGTTQKLIGGSFYMEVEDNRLDAKFLFNVANSPGSYTITDQFTMMKDVDKTSSLTITNGQSATLSASFISDYAWSNPTTGEFTASTRSVVVTPAISTTYVVRDSKNCLLDVFKIQVTGSGTMFSIKTGNWNDPTVWSGNRVPVSTDTIQVRHTITIPAGIQAHAMTVQFDPNAKLAYGLNARLLLSQ